MREIVMTIYPVPKVVTEARVHLANDQEAKANPKVIIDDVADVAGVEAEVEREALLDIRV
jgi:hypothetical protein